MSRMTLYLAVTAVFLAVVMTITSITLLNQRNVSVNALSSDIAKQAAAVSVLLKHTETQNRQELEYFADLSLVQQALLSGQYTQLEELLRKLMKRKSSIVQSRLLDPQGREVFKLVTRGGVPMRLADVELQDKSERYYVKQLLDVPSTRSYMSAVDLNVDYGVVEVPYRPVLRIAQKITNPNTGQVMGSLMFNYDVNVVFSQLGSLIPDHMQLYIVDYKNQFLAHPQPELRYCAELECELLYSATQLSHLAHQRVYFDQSLAAEVNLDSAARPVVSGSKLVVAYKPSYLPALTQPLSAIAVLSRSMLWWAILLVSLLLSAGVCYSYEHLQKQLDARLQKAKMQKVLEGVTEMLERLHENDDPITGSHVQRVSYYSRLMAEHLGLDKQLVDDIHQFASLHDIGKISTPDAILGKPGKLDPQEWEVMKQHVDNGYQLLRDFELSPVAENIVRGHHERWDGEGYPQKIAGEEIPIEARIVSLVDCFDALMSVRPYKPAFSFEKSKGIINELSGKAFDPYLVQVFNFLENDFRKSRSKLSKT
ncbi:HD domain-containing phosphohydrolase [Agarivorans sp. 1_MG-2023]|uniref:HD domain-containing phosphohydrolase n=1 Tax=Agarivorans sp. 1_MG-2023 TaxID=3062634 RepID=UPI0026E2ED91|nr:HD domain-containing phosphohydrolase [Agarivorans sp. 1_MG-2023]MDO6763423.1 HD domain-containing protein [Agarivorans sp. 1_MG-2023]